MFFNIHYFADFKCIWLGAVYIIQIVKHIQCTRTPRVGHNCTAEIIKGYAIRVTSGVM